jgi:ankyrin repeat protein
MSLLINAVEANNLSLVKELIGDGHNINEKDKYGYSALHVASSKGRLDIAAFLINNGIELNARDKSGGTILHYVAVFNQIDIGTLALKHGADLSIEDSYGNQPLWTAVFNDKGRGERMELIRLYLQNGADPNHTNNVGKSPKDILIRRGDENLLSLM